MAIFPTLSPGSRTFTPGDYYHSAFSSYNGQQSRVSHSTGMTTSRLELVYPVMSAADMQQILNHYIAQLGRYASFQVPAEVLAGFTASDFRLSGYGWRYADSPQVEEFASDLGVIYYTVRVMLESVADSGSVVGGYAPTVRVTLTAGPVTNNNSTNGASITITTSLASGAATASSTITGADLVVAVSLAVSGANDDEYYSTAIAQLYGWREMIFPDWWIN